MTISRKVLLLGALLWLGASIAGTLGDSLPREVYFVTADDRGIDVCEFINPEAVQAGQAAPSEWCTRGEVLGESLPTDARTITGAVTLDGVSAWSLLGGTLARPDLWLTVGVGGAALIFLYEFSRATGTVRAGLAVAISVVFLGLLLFPTTFTARIPADMRSELVTAWQLVVLFYFGSEAAVQAFRIVKGRSEVGDLAAPHEVSGTGPRAGRDQALEQRDGGAPAEGAAPREPGPGGRP